MDTYTDIEYSVDDPVALIRLNRPNQLNAFTYHTLREIRQAVDQAAADRRVVGIVITATGAASAPASTCRPWPRLPLRPNPRPPRRKTRFRGSSPTCWTCPNPSSPPSTAWPSAAG